MALGKEKNPSFDLICKRYEFQKESNKYLECGAPKILKDDLQKGAIAPEEVGNVLPK